jgi:hypothetical protein
MPRAVQPPSLGKVVELTQVCGLHHSTTDTSADGGKLVLYFPPFAPRSLGEMYDICL